MQINKKRQLRYLENCAIAKCISRRHPVKIYWLSSAPCVRFHKHECDSKTHESSTLDGQSYGKWFGKYSNGLLADDIIDGSSTILLILDPDSYCTVTTLVSDTFVNKDSIVQYTDSTVPNFNAVCFRIAGLE